MLVIPNPKLPDSIPVVSCLLPSSLQAGLALYRRSLQISAVCKLALQVYVGIDAPYLHFELVAKNKEEINIRPRGSTQHAQREPQGPKVTSASRPSFTVHKAQYPTVHVRLNHGE